MAGWIRFRGAMALLAFVFLAIATAGAHAEKRVALVIGNSKYKHAAELRNPANDANLVADKLSALSFQVIKGIDLDEGGMRQAINEFAHDLATAEVALLFYAGHGLQVSGQNYLLPVTADLKNEIDLQFQGVAVNFLLRIMESSNRTSILLLDACRNNPLADRLARSMTSGRGATVSSGLARIETGVGTYIGFATSPDSVALDGDGDNSPFTTALARYISSPGVDIESIMRNVRSDVISATNGHQVPWGNSSLIGRGFIFNKAESEGSAKVAAAAPGKESGAQTSRELESAVLNTMRDQTEAIYWQSIQGADDPQYYEIYLKRFPNGVFAEIARLKIDALKRSAAAKDESKAEEPAAKQFDEAAPADVARLDTKTQVEPEPQEGAQSAAAEPLTRESIAEIQSELVRLGCLGGRADGIWGNQSRRAVEAYAQEKGAKLASLEPTLDLFNELKAVGERVCPLTCGRGEALVDGACVAEKPTKPASKTATIERKQKSASKQNNSAIQSILPNQQSSQGKKTIHERLKNLNESNRHMMFGQDSDGAQM